jgi:hypothetical protein
VVYPFAHTIESPTSTSQKLDDRNRQEKRENESMVDRYTQHARKTVYFARYEASQFGSACIEPHHLLLALLRVGKPLFALWSLGSPEVARSIRAEVEREFPWKVNRERTD